MAQSLGVVSGRGTELGRRPASTLPPVGASFSFDPGADGIAGIYAARVLERGIDPRLLCADIRADRLGAVDRELRRRALKTRQRATRFGRGTAQSLRAGNAFSSPVPVAAIKSSPPRSNAGRGESAVPPRARPRQLAIAGLFALLLVPLGVILAGAQEPPPPARSIVQHGDTLQTVAAEAAAIPGPNDSPDAAANARAAAPSPPPMSSPPAHRWPASPPGAASTPGP